MAELEARVHDLEGELDNARCQALLAESCLVETRTRLAEAREASTAACDQICQLVEENSALEAELRENVESSLEWSRASGAASEQP